MRSVDPSKLGISLNRNALTALVVLLLLGAALGMEKRPGPHGQHALSGSMVHKSASVSQAASMRRVSKPHGVVFNGPKGPLLQGPLLHPRIRYHHEDVGKPVVVAGSHQHAAHRRHARLGRRSGWRVAASHEARSRFSAHERMEWLTPPAALPAPSLQRAYLSLSVNGMDQGQILALVGDGEVWVAVDDLVRAGLRELDVPTQTIDGRSYVSSRHLTPGIEFTFDDRNLAVQLTAPTRYFGTTTVKLGGSTPRGMVYGKNTSAFFNYALDWQNLKQFSEFSELGLSSRGNLYYTGFSVAPGGKFIRGLSNATFDNPARMTRWVLGDTFASGGTLGGGTFLGGITFSRDFSLNPYFVRYPGVQLSGQTLTPSSADIYVNGHLVGTRALPPGKFDITGLPLVAGGGTTQVIVRDAFGHTQTLSSSYYFATSVLQRGLSEYSYSLGAQRNDVGTASSNYGPLVFVGFDRVGVTDWFTAGMRVDGGPGLVSGGPTAAFRLGRGQLGINASASHAAGIGGAAAEADYTYQNRSLSYGGSLALTSPHYATLSLASAADRETSLASAFAGFELGPRASLTVNYATSRWRDSGSRQDLSLAGYLRLSHSLDLVATADHFHASSSANTYTLSLNYQIGRNTLGAVSQQGGSLGAGSAVSIQQSLPLGTGVGYRLEHGGGSQVRDDDLVQVQMPFGLYQASFVQSGGFVQKDLLASGGLVDAGNGVMFTRAVENGYAIIDLPGLHGVRGYYNNQEIGRTDSKGRLFIPNLLAYYGNRVEISDQDVPLNYSIDATEETVAPPYRGGALVHFPLKREVAVTGIMVVDDPNTHSVPSFGELRVTVAGKSMVSELDGQGEFFLEDVLPGRYAGELEYADGSCAFQLVVPQQHDAVTQVGSVRCTPPHVSRLSNGAAASRSGSAKAGLSSSVTAQSGSMQ